MKISTEFKVNLSCFICIGFMLALFSSVVPSWSWLAFIILSCLTIILGIISFRLYFKTENYYKYHNFFLIILITISMVVPFLRAVFGTPLFILFLGYLLFILFYSFLKRNSIFSAYHDNKETRKMMWVYFLSSIVVLFLVFTLKNSEGTHFIMEVINRNLNPYFNSPYSGFIICSILYIVGIFLAFLSASNFAEGKEPPREKMSYGLKKLRTKNKKSRVKKSKSHR